MKIKIFKKGGHGFWKRKQSSKQILEDEVNNWLEANKGIEIKDIKQSCCGGSLEPSITVISIWYEAAN